MDPVRTATIRVNGKEVKTWDELPPKAAKTFEEKGFRHGSNNEILPPPIEQLEKLSSPTQAHVSNQEEYAKREKPVYSCKKCGYTSETKFKQCPQCDSIPPKTLRIKVPRFIADLVMRLANFLKGKEKLLLFVIGIPILVGMGYVLFVLPITFVIIVATTQGALAAPASIALASIQTFFANKVRKGGSFISAFIATIILVALVFQSVARFGGQYVVYAMLPIIIIVTLGIISLDPHTPEIVRKLYWACSLLANAILVGASIFLAVAP
ncbi:MAG: hypothetical protein KAW41_00140 [Candidatus Diapherotrites archaeon]|nr:hypothetical protein [Candidatus Diapherotrites archaeon]